MSTRQQARPGASGPPQSGDDDPQALLLQRFRQAWDARLQAAPPARPPAAPADGHTDMRALRQLGGLQGLVGECVCRVSEAARGWKAEYTRAHGVRPFTDCTGDDEEEGLGAAPSAGAARLQEVRATLDLFLTDGEARSLDQKRFHDAMLVSCAELILGKVEFQRERPGLLQQLGRATYPFGTLILCPRRWGKSTSVACFCAALLYLCGRVRLLIMATQIKSAALLMKSSLAYFMQLPGAGERIIENNAFRLVVQGRGVRGSRAQALRTASVNSITACAPTESSVRGESANLILVDEAAFVSPHVMAVLAPLLTVAGTSIICISTPAGSENWYTRLFLPPAEGPTGGPSAEDMFLRFHVDLLCQACRQSGAAPEKCHHNAHLAPAWLPASSQQRAGAFMPGGQLFAQELLGNIVTGGAGLLDSAAVARLLRPLLAAEEAHARAVAALGVAYGPAAKLGRLARAREAAQLALLQAGERLEPGGRRVAYSLIDPAGQGASEFAIVTVVPHPGRAGTLALVGVACISGRREGGPEAEFARYWRALSVHPALRDAHFVVGIESNFGGSHFVQLLLEQWVAPHLSSWEQWLEPAPPAARPAAAPANGLVTTQHAKNTGAHLLSERLKRDTLVVAQGLVHAGRPGRLEVLRELEAQLQKLDYAGGSVSGKKSGRQDDLAIALLLLCYWLHVTDRA